MNAHPTSAQRLYHLDAVRAFALLLGIVFHASLSFTPMYIGWAVMDISTSSLVSVFMLVSHSFRMELFFLIAGFFSHMTFHQRGFRAFAKSRLTRIALPFVIGWFILRPLLVSGWVMGMASLRGEVNILEGLQTGIQSLNTLPAGILVGTHLWFLYDILLVTAATLALRSLLKQAPQLHATAATAADRACNWLAHSKLTLPLLSAIVASGLWFMSHWGMDTPDKSLVPHLPTFFVYGGFFGFGWILHRQASLLDTLSRFSWTRLLNSAGAIAAITALSKFESDYTHENYTLLRAGFAFAYAYTMLCLVFLTIGLFKKCCNRPNRFIRYVADSSYWLYLVHLPVVVWLQVAFAELPFHWSLKLGAIFLITVATSLLVYDLLVRPTLAGKILNGSRKQSCLLAPFRKAPHKPTAAQSAT
ncbi:acyltransferase family protein [Pelagicoccus sp. SDUM812005]|uniref:acyltransferase family protein n=1 Tax=Pelagicoccus sp. SDUM812005 TaxID=3041257 RepID=UPI0028105F11|nr:acyltransferase family protein [Pelagicoccus sp. SDUM812005]MDQ8180720.1 acyltransferase family protein [Pelagicoccus sp. SDUM812005]